jgi:hypothetical protein
MQMTERLQRVHTGDQVALDTVIALVYAEVLQPKFAPKSNCCPASIRLLQTP